MSSDVFLCMSHSTRYSSKCSILAKMAIKCSKFTLHIAFNFIFASQVDSLRAHAHRIKARDVGIPTHDRPRPDVTGIEIIL